MKYPLRICILILLAAAGAAALRVPALDIRPMHTDEAVHAIKFGELLDQGNYRYDSFEYHGPTLNYFSLLPAWLASTDNFTDITEFTLRIVPVFFGVLLVFLFIFLIDGLGARIAVYAAILTAISPVFVFYSRYYIQETLLVCFTFAAIACGYRYSRSRSISWAIATGIFAGLMHATKETCIIAFASIFAAIVLTRFLGPNLKQNSLKKPKVITIPHILIMLVSAAIVSAMFYSSFFSNPDGVFDSFRTYTTYFDRAGQNQLHIHPWYYYLKMLIFSQYNNGPIFTEAFIVVFALIGLVVVFAKKEIDGVDSKLLRFIAIYTLLMTLIYSVIPYKTPWCMLGFFQGMIILAAVGILSIVQSQSTRIMRAIVIVVLAIGAIGLVSEAFASNYTYYASSANPYVYAHPTDDVYVVKQRIEQILKAHPQTHTTEIHVICSNRDYWPLPWYFRSIDNIGWFDSVDHQRPNPHIVIASADLKSELLAKLYDYPPPGQKDLYVPLFDSTIWLRPQVELVGFVTKELWDAYSRSLVEPLTIKDR